MSESRVLLRVTLDSVKAAAVVFNSWRRGLEKPSASHGDKCDISCLGKKSKCSGVVWVVTAWAAGLQRCSCDPQAEGIYTFILA